MEKLREGSIRRLTVEGYAADGTGVGRLEGMDPQRYTAQSFEDVASGVWYAPYVEWAIRNGVISGYGNGKFGPNDPITREQMAVIMYRYAQFKGIDVSVTDSSRFESFTDKDSVSSYAKEAMIWATANGIINGTDVGLEPQKNASRAQVAQIIKNYSEKIISVPESE